jgi:outer membrane lipoprotein-sorting protein
MMDMPPSHASDDPLDRAADALRRACLPEGLPEETSARTLATLRAAAEAKTTPFYRRKPKRYAWKIAVAGLLAAGVAIYFSGILSPRPPLAFGEIASKLRDARSLTYKITVKRPKQKEPEKMKISFKEPGWVRAEGEGQISIIDMKQNYKSLILDTKTKTAMLIEYKKAKDAKKDAHENPLEMIERLRKLADKKSDSAGKKRIGDIEAEGFRVEEEGFPLTVWANPKTKMPVLIEMPIRVAEQENLVTVSDFQLDPKLDDALFSLEPPEGYKLRKMEMEEGKPEEDVARLLRAYADKYDGKFPKSLSVASTDWQTYLKQHWGDKKPKGLPETEAVQFIGRAMRVEKFLHANKDHGYKPDGVKFGDRDKIIFWYRPDKAEKYRAVFGDLHVADVSADQLPEKPKK